MSRKADLKSLVERFDKYYKSGKFDETSEATARTWIEMLLGVFGWDCSNPQEIDQESSISDDAINKMSEIESTHKTPDYSLLFKDEVMYYLDAKQTSIDIKNCKKTSFQIRAYGWSSGLPIAIVTNFKELAIYDARYKPEKTHDANVGLIHYFKYQDYLNNFNELDLHLGKENVQTRRLNERYSTITEQRGSKTLDQDFAEFLGEWRIKFASEIFLSNKNSDLNYIQEEVQFLLDRVIFLRVAEGKKVEKLGRLKEIAKKENSYDFFINECKTTYLEKFGGYLFSKAQIRNLKINSKIFSSFLECLYFPFPYMFEVIPTELLGNMYEQFLGKRLTIKSGKISDEFKPEYQKQNGAVYTPRYIVNSVCSETLSPFFKSKKIRTIRSVLDLKIIDPSCGSGSFLMGIYDFLSFKVKEIIKSTPNLERKYDNWYWKDPRRNRIFLKVAGKRQIINSCIFGIDIDAQAVEVSRLSLSLKALEGGEISPLIVFYNLDECSILSTIGENIKHGNSLIDSEIYKIFPEIVDDVSTIENLKVFDWKKEFKDVFDGKGGFDAVVGNPPYIETKHFKKECPFLHKLLTLRSNRVYETAGGGKLDVAMPFIERGIKKLNSNGRLGYIVTNRFFKTDYGKATREYLSKNKHIESILDFGELKVFKGRSTYTSILQITKKANEKLRYFKVENLKDIDIELEKFYSNSSGWTSFPYSTIGLNPWNFAFPDLLKLTESLQKKFKKISDIDKISIKVGLQVLIDKIYHLEAIKVTDKLITGINGLGKQVEIEKGFCRPIVCNENFYSFKVLAEDFFCLFPYRIADGKDIELTMNEIKKLYPKAYKYLQDNKGFIQKEVDTIDDEQRWHLFTRKQNLVSQSVPKVLFPSTILDTVATFDYKGTFYQDNVRVNSIIIDNASPKLYGAIAAVINSSLFNCLAKVTTNPLQEGHVQFNKQFVEPIPFPLETLEIDTDLTNQLYDLAQEISKLTHQLANDNSATRHNSIKQALANKWIQLDVLVEKKLYCLTKEEAAIAIKYPRKEDRIEYFLKLNAKEEAS